MKESAVSSRQSKVNCNPSRWHRAARKRRSNPLIWPQKEEFWDRLSEDGADISMVGIRSATMVEEIDNLVDQLPDD